MESIIELVIAVLCYALVVITTKWWGLRKENEQLNDELVEARRTKPSGPSQNQPVSRPNIGTRDLLMQTLTNIGCQYQLGEDDDDRIYFAYQGEHFFADCVNEARYVHLYDPFWGHVELYDIDEVSRLRRAINTANMNCGVTIVFTIDEDGKNMDVHTRAVIPFQSQMPDLEDHLRIELNEFFRAHQVLFVEMTKLRGTEDEKTP